MFIGGVGPGKRARIELRFSGPKQGIGTVEHRNEQGNPNGDAAQDLHAIGTAMVVQLDSLGSYFASFTHSDDSSEAATST